MISFKRPFSVRLLLFCIAPLFLTTLSFFSSAGSLGDLNGGEDPSDDVSMSGEEGGASDQEDSAECDGSSPPSFTPLYNEGETTQLSYQKYQNHLNVPLT